MSGKNPTPADFEYARSLESFIPDLERLFDRGSPHNIDIVVRKDAKETRLEGDYLKGLLISLKKHLAQEHP